MLYLPFKGTILSHRADFEQGMESVSLFKMNTATEYYWLIYAATIIYDLIKWGIIYSQWKN